MEQTLDRQHLLTDREMRVSSSVAMVMTMVSFSMLFATLFLGYFLHRLTSDVWPPAGIARVSYELPTLSTFLILLSSVFYWRFERSFLAVKKISNSDFFGSLLFGIGFVVSQFFLWKELKSIGIFVDTTIFGSIIYGFTWIHVAHMVLGFIALAFVFFKTRSATFSTKEELWVQNVGKFWHFLSVVWLLMFFGIFIF